MKRLLILVLTIPLAGCMGLDDYGYGGNIYEDTGHPIVMPSSCGCAAAPSAGSFTAASRVTPTAGQFPAVSTAEPPR